MASAGLIAFWRSLGVGIAFTIWAAVLLGARALPALDVVLLPSARFARVPLGGMLRFAVVAMLAGPASTLVIRSTLLEAFKIPSGSMVPSLEVQDHLFVNKWHYGPVVPFFDRRFFARLPPARGDLIVFEYPDPDPSDERQDFAKRVIAIGGDTLEVDAGHPIINGWQVPSCLVGPYMPELPDARRPGMLFVEFLGNSSYLIWLEDLAAPPRRSGPYRVVEGESWVLGDNRFNSSDSVHWNGGRGAGLPDENIKGLAMFIWLSFGARGGVTWARIGTDLLGPPRAPTGAAPELARGIDRCLAARPLQTLPPNVGTAL